MENIIVRENEGVATVIINDPAHHNAISYAGWLELARVANQLEQDDNIEVVVFTGAGDRDFCTGSAVADFDVHRANSAQAKTYDAAYEAALEAIEGLSKPTISMIRGYCVGGGCTLAMATDIRVAHNAAGFSIPAARLGIVLSYRDLRRLVSLVGHGNARYMLLSARLMDADEALRIGLINTVVPKEVIVNYTYQLAKDMASLAPLSQQGHKKMLRTVLRNPLLTGLTPAEENLAFSCFDSKDYAEGRRAALEARQPKFKRGKLRDAGSRRSQEAIAAKLSGAPQNFIEFNREDVERSLPWRFEQQVRRHPERVAIKTSDVELTYEALNNAANHVARAILEKADAGSEPIALLFGQDAGAITALLGVLKTGKIYVPLDPSLPRPRLNYMLQDSRAPLVVTNGRYAALSRELVANECSVLNIDALDLNVASDNLGLSISPDTLAVIVYTSGSTGQPKGVIHSHRNVMHLIMTYTNLFRISTEDRLSLLYPWSVNAALRDIFGALLNGTTVCPMDIKNEWLGDIGGWLMHEGITIWATAPSILRHTVDTLTGKETFPRVRLIVLGGERTRRGDVASYKRFFSPDCILANRLGSTETGNLRFYLIDKDTEIDGEIVPVGYEVEGNEILLLDDDGKEVGFDRPGEIVVKSRYLSRGYWQKTELTDAAFAAVPGEVDKRIYRTGDLGIMRPDGCLVHVGRKDMVVKVRGNRVDLSEIETRLLELDAVREAVVVPREAPEGEQRLVAYVVPTEGHAAPTGTMMRERLAQSLPNYMLPFTFVVLDKMPLTPNGKVDLRELPAPEISRSTMGKAFAPPRNQVERDLLAVWVNVLDLGEDAIGIEDNFFDFGGDSIKVLHAVSRARAYGYELTLLDFIEHPTIAALAACVEAKSRRHESEIDEARTEKIASDPGGLASPTPAQLRYFTQRRPIDPQKYPLAPTRVERALATLIERHDVLRLRFEFDGRGIPTQRFLAAASARACAASSFSHHDLARLDPDAAERERLRIVSELQGSFDLRDGPLFRVAHFGMPDGADRLWGSIHHLLLDPVSWHMFWSDLEELVVEGAAAAAAPAATTPFRVWAGALAEHAKSAEVQASRKVLQALPWTAIKPIPLDTAADRFDDNINSAYAIERLEIRDPMVVSRLSARSRGHRLDLIVTAAVAQILAEWSGGASVLIDRAGLLRGELLERPDLDVSRTFGYFVNYDPIVLTPPRDRSPDAFVGAIGAQIQEQQRAAVHFDLLRYLAGDTALQHWLDALPRADVCLNYRGTHELESFLDEEGPFVMAEGGRGPTHSPRGRRSHPLNIGIDTAKDALFVTVTYSQALHQAETIRGWVRELERRIISLAVPARDAQSALLLH